MAATPLSQAVLAGMDPNVYRPLGDMQTGNELFAQGSDSSPTSKWGAIGRLAQALSGTYLQNSATSDLARTIAGGKKSATDQLMAALEAQQQRPATVPSSAPAMTPSPAASPAAPVVPPSAAPEANASAVAPPSPNAQVANRFPAEMSPVAHAPDPGSANDVVANRFPGGSAFMASAQPPVAPAAPAQTAAPDNPVAAIAAATQPRGIRNNNALNIEDGPFAKSQPGYAGSDGRFARFQTPDHGVAAANALLDSYDKKHGVNTVAGIVNRWAPPSDGNNTMAYASDVAGKLGIDPNAPVPPAMRQQLIAAMAQHENGRAAPGTSAGPGAAAAPVQLASAAPMVANDADPEEAAVAAPAKDQQVAQASGGYDAHKLMAVLQNPYADDTTKQLAQKLLLQQLTQENPEFKEVTAPDGTKRQVWVNAKEQTVTPVAGQQAPPAYAGLQGPELMAAVKQANPAMAAQAQAVLEGRVPYPTGSRLNPQQQQLKELVTQIDPNFTAANSKVMQDTLQDYGTKGRTGQARVAANTMLGHADTLDKLIPKLGNYTYFPGVANAAHDFVAGNTDPEYQKVRGEFETTKKALSTEAEKALAGHTTLAGINEQMSNLDRAKSPEELHAAVHGLVHVLGSRLESMASGFDTSMKTRTQGHEFLDPKGREIFNRFEGINAPASGDVGRIPQLEGAAPASGSAAATPAAPDRAAIEAEMKRRGLTP